MKRTWHFLMAFIVSIGIADAAVRDAKSTSRAPTQRTSISRNATTGTNRATVSRTASRANTSHRTDTSRATSTRTARTATTGTQNGRTPTSTARTATTGTQPLRQSSGGVSRSGTRPSVARATVTLNVAQSNTFGTGYNTCRDAYFTCMDQFCSTANDAYRRCICSSRLTEIQKREQALTQASDQLQDFHSLNLGVIDKTAAEVTHMLRATDGESTQASTHDTSASASMLAGIGDILSKSKKKALSTQGTLDIGGNIDSIWSTTDLAGGANISNLTGEALYNAVHAQCSEMVADKCNTPTTQTMVTTAYGMYIENDCSLILDSLDERLATANGTIRGTEREMQLARLENYNKHNSTSINDCIARVRDDITSDAACGTDYVHCLDLTGLYLNYETGEPIYSPKFYQLESMTSLAGDVLTNETNRMLVAKLNGMRIFAERGLDTCRDISNDVWDEFLRQAITEIYQGQQSRIRQVKNECLDVVNQCYDTQTQSLRDFSNISEQLLLGSRLELSEQMCREKLDACSNLYGGGPHGMSELLIAMADITTQTIGQQCLVTLQDYARDLCAVPGNDTLHTYPYGCRIYAPGEQRYAQISKCNTLTQNYTGNDFSVIMGGSGDVSITPKEPLTINYCRQQITYTSCAEHYWLSDDEGKYSKDAGNKCAPCPKGYTCEGGTAAPECPDRQKRKDGLTENQYKNDDCVPKTTDTGGTTNQPTDTIDCGPDYVGSLYHKMARYAIQACVRPSAANDPLPTTVLMDINVVMDQIRQDMSTSLAAECERLGGEWVDTEWTDISTETTPANGYHDITGDQLYKKFYTETSANTKWGYCKKIDTTTTTQTQ